MKDTVYHNKFGNVSIIRTRRTRRISISVRPPAEVRLSLPAGYSLSKGLAFLDQKSEWVASAIDKISKRCPPCIIGHDYTTARRTLIFTPCAADKISARISESTITITHPEYIPHSAPEVQEAARQAVIYSIKSEAKDILPPKVEELAREHGFRYGKVTVRVTKSRWGSCSAQNNISLCAFLVRLPEHLIEYVILHELCHTVHKNHSPKFHALLDSVLNGKEKELARELRLYRADFI